jgi:hypothetical protein
MLTLLYLARIAEIQALPAFSMKDAREQKPTSHLELLFSECSILEDMENVVSVS